MADHTYTTDRRTAPVLGGAERRSPFGAAALPCPDAGLLRLCAGFHDADARCHAAPDDGMDWKAWLDRRWSYSDQIEAMTPHTLAGRLAKARVALVLLEEASDLNNEYERFAVTALRNLVAGGAA